MAITNPDYVAIAIMLSQTTRQEILGTRNKAKLLTMYRPLNL